VSVHTGLHRGYSRNEWEILLLALLLLPLALFDFELDSWSVAVGLLSRLQ
jgi:hypothetical protein